MLCPVPPSAQSERGGGGVRCGERVIQSAVRAVARTVQLVVVRGSRLRSLRPSLGCCDERWCQKPEESKNLEEILIIVASIDSQLRKHRPMCFIYWLVAGMHTNGTMILEEYATYRIVSQGYGVPCVLKLYIRNYFLACVVFGEMFVASLPVCQPRAVERVRQYGMTAGVSLLVCFVWLVSCMCVVSHR